MTWSKLLINWIIIYFTASLIHTAALIPSILNSIQRFTCDCRKNPYIKTKVKRLNPRNLYYKLSTQQKKLEQILGDVVNFAKYKRGRLFFKLVYFVKLL